jgi:hypothetical protein
MMLFKSCPRCHGDLALEELPGEAEFVCIQCGFREAAVARTKPVASRRLSRVPRAA